MVGNQNKINKKQSNMLRTTNFHCVFHGVLAYHFFFWCKAGSRHETNQQSKLIAQQTKQNKTNIHLTTKYVFTQNIKFHQQNKTDQSKP